MRHSVPLDLAPEPIQDTIRYWQNVGTSAGDVWQSVTGHRRRSVRWCEVAALLMAEMQMIARKEAA